ncbi:transcription factor E2F7-like isoform X2 [Heterodontus francisci]|uniref:transcription factor E2F7-like isoform X2 n=1 Tax=Heterodontus francisci TaxID=7792 RepID=UPI00355B3BC9
MSCLKLKDLVSTRIGKCDFPSETLNSEIKIAQKENLFIEPKRMSPKTPVKNELMPSVVLWNKCCSPDRVQVTPIKHIDKSSPEPWSPTANLKMLISAASPDIRDREKKKELFRQIENEGIGSISNVIQLGEVDDATTDEFEQQRPSRKLKSLGLLCQKFLARYPNYPISTEKTEISLDEVATELGVERRRIYDIVNVLESLQLVSRMAKNQYSWHGLLGLRQTLAALKRRGEQHRYAEQLAYIRHKELEFDGEEAEKRDTAQEARTSCQALSRETKSVEAESKAAKIRRLYDIANVLTSLGLIKKVHVTEERGRKPAFKWVGPIHQNKPDGIPDHFVALSASPSSAEAVFPVTVNTKERLACAASFHTRHNSHTKQFKAQSAPCSPAKVRKVRTLDAQDYSSKMAHLAAACRLQFEEDLKNSESHPKQDVCQPKSIPLASCPLLIPSTTSAVDYPVEPLAQNSFTAAQSELSLPFCLSNGASWQRTTVPPPAVPGTDEGHPCLLQNQPIVFLQSLSATPVLMLCRNREPSTELSPGSSQAQHCMQEQASSLGHKEKKAGVSTRHSRKRSPMEQCTVPHEPWQDGKPEAKRGKTLCCIEHASGSHPSALPLSPMDKQSSNQRNDTLRNRTKSLNQISETAACPPSQTINVDLESIRPSTGTQTDDCHTDPRNAEERNHIVMVESEHPGLSFAVHPLAKEGNQEPLGASGNLVPSPVVIQDQSGLAENNQCYHLPAAPGMRELNLLLSTNQSLSGITIPGQMGSVGLPYQVMVPVFCPTLPATKSAGNSIQNTGLMHFNLQNLSLLPSTQLLMSGVSVPTPTRTTVRSSSPEQIYSPVFAQASREDLPTKLQPPVQQPATIKLKQQSPIPITPKDGQQSFVETYFHTPVPIVQGKKMEGLQVKVASHAQRRLEIENNVTK